MRPKTPTCLFTNFDALLITDYTVRILNRNGIQVNKENAQIILDFLYHIAKTFKTQDKYGSCNLEPKGEIEPLESGLLLSPMH